MRIGQKIRAWLQRRRSVNHGLATRGRIKARLFRDGKLLSQGYFGSNGVVTEGKDHMLDSTFDAATQDTTWFIGLIDGASTPTLLAADTLPSHTGWTENTDYAGTRKAWDPAPSVAGSMGTTSTSDFTMDATATIAGIFVCGVTSGTAGTLWATGLFDANVPVVNTDVLKITYETNLNG